MRLTDLLLLALGAVVIAGLAGAPYPVYAAEPECLTLQSVVTAVEEAGGQMQGGAVINGKRGDMVVIFTVNETVKMIMFKAGCVVTMPLVIDVVPPKGTPA